MPTPASSRLSTATRSTVDPRRAHSARIWNFWLGGADYYEPDRRVGEGINALYPEVSAYARADRQFLGRAVRQLAGPVGIRQFLDIGTGLPTAENTHEIAQGVAPDARIVYVDNDPTVLAHARALLVSAPEGRTGYVDADVRDVDGILEQAADTLDFGRPVALLLLGVLIFVEDDEEAGTAVRRLMAALPPGSHLVLSHTVRSSRMPEVDAAVAYWNQHGSPALTQRTPEAIARLMDGLDVLPPGLVPCSRWRASGEATDEPEVGMYGAVARKR
ncbi:SAM-dependent methyltransferase [Streptomyces sp. NPDC059578]|uniref:SAM-dependent methyltransferase n=1 Tax=unclassified Streptomyces TaxID=2593676 RepID=UPI00365A15BE